MNKVKWEEQPLLDFHGNSFHFSSVPQKIPVKVSMLPRVSQINSFMPPVILNAEINSGVHINADEYSWHLNESHIQPRGRIKTQLFGIKRRVEREIIGQVRLSIFAMYVATVLNFIMMIFQTLTASSGYPRKLSEELKLNNFANSEFAQFKFRSLIYF